MGVKQNLDAHCMRYIRDWLEMPMRACVREQSQKKTYRYGRRRLSTRLLFYTIFAKKQCFKCCLLRPTSCDGKG